MASSADLFGFYGARVSSEIQRLRVNTERRVYVIFEAGIGYVQCRPQRSPAARLGSIYASTPLIKNLSQ